MQSINLKDWIQVEQQPTLRSSHQSTGIEVWRSTFTLPSNETQTLYRLAVFESD